MIRKFGFALAAASVLLSLAAIGYGMLFSNLALYDDEGYVLITAREYFRHGGLYQLVYSQYGPAFYVLADVFQFLSGSLLDHTSARLLTLGLWLGTAGCCAVLVMRQTTSRALAAFTMMAVFFYLYFITDEPFHPGSLIIFLLALTLLVATELISRGRLAAAGVVAGGMGAILLLTKINVGAFYLVGVGTWGLLNATSDRVRRAARYVIVGGLVIFAAALMQTLWRESWVQIYLALFAIGAVSLVAVLRTEAIVQAKHVGLFVVGGSVAVLVVLGTVCLRGTSLAALIDGVVLGPLRHPGSYSYPVDWRPGTLVVAGLSLILVLALPGIRRRFSDDAADRLIVTLRLVQTAGLLVGLALLMNFRVVGAIFSYVAPLIWTWVIPLRGAGNAQPNQVGRGLVATVLLLQYLHAYPVGGSQESWGTFLFIPLVALGLWEIRTWQAARSADPLVLPRWWPVLMSVILLVLVAKVGWTARVVHERYAARSDLRLPGAGRLHLADSQRTAYQLLTLNAVVHGDQLFSLPGLFSFNLWTDLPTPTEKNTTLWFTLLNDAEQTAIIQSLERSARPCIIFQESLVQLTLAAHVPIRGILVDYIQRNFVPAFKVEGFAFLVRRGRTIAPLGVARLIAPAAAAGDPDQSNTGLELCLASDGTAIHSIDVADLASPRSEPLTLNSANTQAFLVAVNSSNQPAGTPQAAQWPLQFKGLGRLALHFNRDQAALSPFTTVLRLKNAEGQIISEARLNE